MQNNKLSELIKIIEEKSNVSDIISDYISLEKKGNNHVGLCPFHSDSNPSMSVSDQKGIFKCFVCGAGGGAISFVQNYEGISFIDALKKVADKLKIDWRPYISQREKKINPEHKRGWEINQEALNFFKYNLSNTSDNRLLSYINERGLSKEIIDKFDIGYSSEGLSNFLLNKEFTEDEIVKYGLAKRREDTTLQDYFINRLIFTIKDKDGNIVGFSGRVTEDSKYVKYMNSPETPIFKKSQILYNLEKAKIAANLKGELIVVEGFMDVIALHKAGFDNSIATMGTAFTKQHNKIIKSITNNISLAFDSDVAGINATISTGKTLLNDGFNIDVISIPNGKDFDELLKLGVDKVKETLNDKQKFINFYKNMIYKKLDGQGDNVSFDVLKQLLAILSMNDDKFTASNIINEISEKYKIDKDILDEEYKTNIVKHHQPIINDQSNVIGEPPFIPEYVPPRQTTEETKLKQFANQISQGDDRHQEKIWLRVKEEEIVSYAVMYDFAYEYLRDNPIFISNDEIKDLWSSYINSKENNIPITSEVMIARIETLKDKAIKTIGNFQFQEVHDKATYIELIKTYIHLLGDFNLKMLKDSLNRETDFKEKEHILELIKKIS